MNFNSTGRMFLRRASIVRQIGHNACTFYTGFTHDRHPAECKLFLPRDTREKLCHHTGRRYAFRNRSHRRSILFFLPPPPSTPRFPRLIRDSSSTEENRFCPEQYTRPDRSGEFLCCSARPLLDRTTRLSEIRVTPFLVKLARNSRRTHKYFPREPSKLDCSAAFLPT